MPGLDIWRIEVSCQYSLHTLALFLQFRVCVYIYMREANVFSETESGSRGEKTLRKVPHWRFIHCAGGQYASIPANTSFCLCVHIVVTEQQHCYCIVRAQV